MSTARLQEIVDTAKQVLDTSAPTVPEQHTVSQVLMRRFVRDTPNGRGVRAYSFDSGLLDRPRNPRSVGKLTNFVKIDSEATERLWNQTETKMRAALDAAQTRRYSSSLSTSKPSRKRLHSTLREALRYWSLTDDCGPCLWRTFATSWAGVALRRAVRALSALGPSCAGSDGQRAD